MNKVALISTLAIAVPLLTAGTIQAEPTIEVTKSADTLQLRQTAQVDIRISWPATEANYAVAFPTLILRNLNLIRHGESQETFVQDDQTWIAKIFSFELAPQKTGAASIESFHIPYIDPSNQKGGHFDIPAVEFSIKAMPLWYRAQKYIPAAVFAIFALLGIGIAAILKNRRKHDLAVEAGDSDEQIALDQFNRLISASDGSQSNLISGLNTLVAGYAAKHYLRDNQQRSTEDLLRYLTEAPGITRSELAELKSLLEELNELRFGAGNISESNLRELKRKVLVFFEKKIVVGAPDSKGL